ncbi:leucine-rich repeat domain-containing protein [Pseudomonas sp. Teo4]|uniref:leucine-rich repeat domain-containing protein n=1 Tax=Pseudomonas sp. Teo4 TaxID=3064528 RepID=UPI002ABBB30A|nr:leucine-rich repeat domain-containing protein [Pseudomonas sp. Teo4]MDZ3991293.1 hypothetical protein [Pseudomonas sp. Teo4]
MTTESSCFRDVDTLIASQLPEWLTKASLDQLSLLRISLLQQQHSQHQLATLFAKVTPLDAFAESLLTKALSKKHLPIMDVRQAKVRRTTVFTPAPVGTGALGKVVTEVSESSLLAAALHNFASVEQIPTGAVVTTSLVDAQDAPLALSAESFTRLCRDEDVGGQYQVHLESIFHTSQASSVLEQSARHKLETTLRLAALRGEVDEQTYFQCLPMVASKPHVLSSNARLVPFDLRVLGKRVRGAVAFEVRQLRKHNPALEGVILWVPDDAHGPLRRYANWDALWKALGRRFQAAGYAAFFQRFISERDRMAFSQALGPLLQTQASNLPISLNGHMHAIELPLYQHMRTVRVDTLLDDARVLAVPTAQVKQDEREKRLSDYADAGLNLLGLASLFVPVLGLPLLGIAAAQIADGVYEGFADWTLGDRAGALKHLLGVAENLAAGVALVAIGQVAGRLIERSSYVERLVPVLNGQDQLRLIDAALPGYAVADRQLSIGERTEVEGKSYLRTHQATYQVVDDPQGRVRIQHPSRPGAYSPWLDSNGEGGWRHDLEAPQHWQGPGLLIQRLASDWASVDEQTAEQVMHITGFDEDRLRRLLLEHAPAPARLRDALQRYQAHAQYPELRGEFFEQYIAGLEDVPTPAAQRLRRDFPGLTARGAQEIVEHGGAEALHNLLVSGRVPQALAEQTRWMLRDSRLDRACAGFFQEVAISVDTERLAVGLTGEWSAWPGEQRIELRIGDTAGELVARSGAVDATDIGYIIRQGHRYQALDAAGRELVGADQHDSLFQALWLHLSAAQKQALGDAAVSAEQLRQALALRAAGQREVAAQQLGMAPIESGMRPPVRLGDGRLGYPLSGGDPVAPLRGPVLTTLDPQARQSVRAGLQQLFPHRRAVDIFWLSTLLAQRPGRTLWVAFSELAGQVRRLDQALRVWQGPVDGSVYANRRRAAQLILEAWQPPYYGPGGVGSLVIHNIAMDHWPSLPADVGFGHLHRLCLTNAGFSELDQAFFNLFPNLQTLQLSANRLTRLPSLAGFSELRSLDVQRNRLTTLEGLEHLTGLTQLVANDNALVSLPDLGRLSRLTRLDLQRNQLETVEGVQHLTLMTQLDLSDNRLAALPEHIHWLVRVRYVNLSANRLAALPTGIGRMTALTQLNLADNRLSDLPVTFGDLVNLRILNLRGNRLTAIPSGLERLRALQELYLANNQVVMDSAAGARLEVLSALRTLTLNGNPIGTLPSLRNLDQLQRLSLRGTGLTEFPLAFLDSHPGLFVDLAENLIVELSERALLWIRQHPTRIVLDGNPLDEAILARWRAAVERIDTLSRQGRSVD